MSKQEVRRLQQKRKGKINQIQRYFETYYPSLKLKYCVGNNIRIKYKGEILYFFNLLHVVGNKLCHVSRINPFSWSYNEQKMFHTLLNRFNIKTDFGDKEYFTITVPKYYFIIRTIERQLLKKGILRIVPKLKRKSL